MRPLVRNPLLALPTGFREARPKDYDAFAEQLRKANLFDAPLK